MPIKINNNGTDNEIIISESSSLALNGVIDISGNNNSIIFGDDCISTGEFRLVLGSNCVVEIHEHCTMSHNFIYMQNNSRISIGRHTAFNGSCWIQMHEPSQVLIGNECLFGGDTNITTSDMHSIVDVHTGGRINPAADVVIEDRVWIGARAFILKGCRIGSGSVVGLGSIVSHDVPPNSVAAGNPARVVKTGVSWHHDLMPI